jgi:hypothetical protein
MTRPAEGSGIAIDQLYFSNSSSVCVLWVHFCTLNCAEYDIRCLGRAMCALCGGDQPIVVIGRHQHQFPKFGWGGWIRTNVRRDQNLHFAQENQ